MYRMRLTGDYEKYMERKARAKEGIVLYSALLVLLALVEIYVIFWYKNGDNSVKYTLPIIALLMNGIPLWRDIRRLRNLNAQPVPRDTYDYTEGY